MGVCGILAGCTLAFGQSDSAKKKIKEPKHYFMTTFFFDHYATPERTLGAENNFVKIQGSPGKFNPNESLDKRLQTYKFKQSSGGFYVPVYTKDLKRKDSLAHSNVHVLVTGNYLLASPQFKGIGHHTIFKGGVGVRGIYNSGEKNIWFIDYSPFMTQDISAKSTAVWRAATTIVYDRIVSDRFSFRLGFSKTFLFGDKYRLPYIGFRVGRLNKSYLSVQFPRNVTFSFPLGSHFRANIFSKPMGGLYTFANSDSVYYGNDKSFQFGRYEITGGLNVEYKPNRHFSVYLSAGGVRHSVIAMYSLSSNNNSPKNLKYYFMKENLDNAYFVNIGLRLRFGNVKKVYNNRNMYEVFDINSNVDPGDNNTTITNEIPADEKRVKNIGYKDVQDLIETPDLY